MTRKRWFCRNCRWELIDPANPMPCAKCGGREFVGEAYLAVHDSERRRVDAVAQFKRKILEAGYSVVVWRAKEKPCSEVVIASSDFVRTEARVGFLEYLRGKSDLAARMKAAGFSIITLTSGDLRGFWQSYSLEG